MTEPISSDNSNKTAIVNLLIIGLIVVLAPILTITAIWWQTGALPSLGGAEPPQIPPVGTLETITLSPNNSDPVMTTNVYTGELVLIVEGSVPTADAGLRDIFYIHADDFNLPLETPTVAPTILTINDNIPERLPYNPFHLYTIPYDIGDRQEPIAFTLVTEHTAPSDTRVIRVFVTRATE